MPDSQWFIDNGCELTRPSLIIFRGVYDLSGGKPCNGCNCKDTCPAWPKLQGAVSRLGTATLDVRPRCGKCGSLLNATKVARRGGKCACGQVV